MSRRASKKTRNNAQNNDGSESLRFTIEDFSVYDYSHSLKDSFQQNLKTTSKLTRLGKSLMDEQDWYEKDLSDFDDPQIPNNAYEVQQLRIQSKHKQISPIGTHYHEQGYPIDLWYLIAMYIVPEDIGRFALICQSTHHVVNTVAFWIRLLRRHNKTEARKISRILMKEHLSIVRTHVIKSLYQTYPLFQEHLNKSDSIQKDPHFLLSSRCIRIWHSKRATQPQSYNYYFEFRFDDNQQSKQEIQIQPISPILQASNQYNIDKNSCILHLICSNFVQIGPYMGMILSQITFNVSSDYRHHQLKMWFNSSRLCLQKSKYNKSDVIIDSILRLKVYKWYNSPANFD